MMLPEKALLPASSYGYPSPSPSSPANPAPDPDPGLTSPPRELKHQKWPPAAPNSSTIPPSATYTYTLSNGENLQDSSSSSASATDNTNTNTSFEQAPAYISAHGDAEIWCQTRVLPVPVAKERWGPFAGTETRLLPAFYRAEKDGAGVEEGYEIPAKRMITLPLPAIKTAMSRTSGAGKEGEDEAKEKENGKEREKEKEKEKEKENANTKAKGKHSVPRPTSSASTSTSSPANASKLTPTSTSKKANETEKATSTSSSSTPTANAKPNANAASSSNASTTLPTKRKWTSNPNPPTRTARSALLNTYIGGELCVTMPKAPGYAKMKATKAHYYSSPTFSSLSSSCFSKDRKEEKKKREEELQRRQVPLPKGVRAKMPSGGEAQGEEERMMCALETRGGVVELGRYA
ncbi:hypothetical protein BDV96DRAFT_602196 [Lophiotrema nucula]|uniref:Uncharacterized protein n=1 Tax=Lophiotrema nucula TaxID=690887 RepID=A0A6A5YZE3_9PLEO|nr:hypothetical protein BDV96DRAFT_602196 [Lophiotrema nucula]